ncbi:DNA repair protein RecO [Saccharobesus litoralis]|uniref:DNA repair protein RecO n=1 Tax=Saccharobesus litoralis TaxID=2172099 RepID=A0A2S0VS90_9ALTE|nr:DNA repair protein RecO [Saccharobesus litoralis]AWB67067.1 DNA repair protein RecO [Saccharobesus litoralis]
MTQPTEFQTAYVLHAKPYRDSSLICDLLTEQDGRVAVLAHKHKFTNPFQVFTPLTLRLKAGHGELFFIEKLDSVGDTLALQGNRLYSAYYVNELIVKLLKRTTDSEYFFQQYQNTLKAIVSDGSLEQPLRQFEMTLLDEMGVWPDLTCVTETGEQIEDSCLYHVDPELGTLLGWDRRKSQYSGKVLNAIQQQDWQVEYAPQLAKRLMRELIQFHLKGQPLNSRKFFAQTK